MQNNNISKSLTAEEHALLAAFFGDKDVYTHLNQFDACGLAPLHQAIYDGNLKVIPALISAGADINLQVHDGFRHTPLHFAIFLNETEIAKTLLKLGASFNNKDKELMEIAWYPSSATKLYFLKYLLELGANINAKNGIGETSLHIAIQHYDFDAVRMLLDHGANIEALNKEGETPLLFALRVGAQKDIVKLLLEKGANVNVRDKNYHTPLTRSLDTRDKFNKLAVSFDLVKLLLDYGADNTVPAPQDHTMVQYALHSGNKQLVEYIRHFKKPLPKGVKIAINNVVLIRMWPPKYEKSETSYTRALFKQLFSSTKTNVGHISISIRTQDGETYISHWPGEKPSWYRSVQGINLNLQEDLDEECLPCEKIMLFSLDTKKMISLFKKIGKEAPWFMFGDKKNKAIGVKSYNCSSYVYDLLAEGGLFLTIYCQKRMN